MIDKRDKLGEGATATVHAGWDSELGRAVALKSLHAHLANDPKIRDRFREEGRRMLGLTHPHVASVLAVEDIEGVPTIVRELADGTLADLTKQGGVASDVVAEILRQVLLGLSELLRHGMSHSDLQPTSILRCGDTWKLADLGLGVGGRDDRTMMAGQPRYVAPEFLAGAKVAPGVSDLYSLGAIAYELVAGEAKVDEIIGQATKKGAGANWLAWQMSLKDLPPLTEVVPGAHPGLSAVIARFVAKDPARRCQSFEEALEVLARWRDAPAAAADEATAAPARPAPAPIVTPSGATVRLDRVARPAAPAVEEAPAPVEEPAQDDEASARRRRRLMIIGGGILLWVVVLGWLFWPSSPSGPPAVSLSSTPAGATVTRSSDGSVVGTTPLDVPNAPAGTQLVVTAEGYVARTVTIEVAGRGLHVDLEKEVKPVDEPPPPPPPPAVPATASSLADKLLAAGRGHWTVSARLEKLNYENDGPSEPAPLVLPFGEQLQVRVQSARAANVLLLHVASDGTVTQFLPNPRTGAVRLAMGRETVLPPREQGGQGRKPIETGPPAGHEWMFIYALTSEWAHSRVMESVALPAGPIVYPVGDGLPGSPAFEIVDALVEHLGREGSEWGRAVIEWDLDGSLPEAGVQAP